MLTMLQYPVGIHDFAVQMHAGAAVVSVAMQNGKPYMWALSDKEAPLVEHRFVTIQTGEDTSEEIGDFLFVGTFQSPSGSLTFHLFDAGDGTGDGAEEDEEPGEGE